MLDSNKLSKRNAVLFRKVIKFVLFVLIGMVLFIGSQHWRNSGAMTLPYTRSDGLRIATYNVHYIVMQQETGAWSRGDWDRRKGPLDTAFKTIAADVIVFQEMESFARGDVSVDNLTLDWLLERNPDYRAAAVGTPSEFPSTQPILYRAERVELLQHGWFFFSDTPDVIYSRTFNGSFPAFASWAEFRDMQTGREFRILNMHTDFGSGSNRLQSVQLVANRVEPWFEADETVFLAGDLNARAGGNIIEVLEKAGFEFAPISGATYHFNRGLNLFGAIDHIAYSGQAVLSAPPVVIRDKFDGEWPTDHYPVVGDFELLSNIRN